MKPGENKHCHLVHITMNIGQVMLICTGLICVYHVNKYVQHHIEDSKQGGLDPPVLGDLQRRP